MIKMTITSSHRNWWNQNCFEANVSLDEMSEYIFSLDKPGTSVQMSQATLERVEFSIFDSHTSTWSEVVCEGSEGDMLELVLLFGLALNINDLAFVDTMLEPENLVYLNLAKQPEVMH